MKPPDTKQALAMLDAFAGVGATVFDISMIDINEKPRAERERRTTDELKRTIAIRLEAAARARLNFIVRPRSTTALLVQLDDIQDSALWPYAFMRLETSPGNYQYWLAVSDGPQDGDTAAEKEAAKIFRYRMRRGAGADKFASGAVRMAGSLNIKHKYAPDFPVVMVSRVEPGRTTTVDALASAGLIGPPPITAAGSVPLTLEKPKPRADAPRYWPDYHVALAGGKFNKDQTAVDRSLADFMWCKWAAERGWKPDEIAYKLVEVSEKARDRLRRNPNDRYAQITAAKAAEAALRDRRGPRQNLKSSAHPR
jgi:hypothetical protein